MSNAQPRLMSESAAQFMPARFDRPKPLNFVGYMIGLAFLVMAIDGTGISLGEFIDGLPSMGRIIGEMMPPDLSRIDAVGWALLETFQMALVGTALGVAISLPMAIMASRGLAPNPVLYFVARSMISWFRTVPDLIWALFFVVAVGLGPFAGTLAIMVDTIGFCGRFFAEAMEEVERGPQEALTALGATRTGTIFSAVIPAAMPSFINTSLFSLEKATRASVILGLVGAGGIGIELKVSMDMFQYAEAATIIGCIFVLVIAVERASTALRQRIL